MKKLIVSAFMLAAIAATSYARTTTPAATVTKATEDDKTKVDPAALPDAVKTTLAGDAYKGWTVSSAWLVKTEPSYYTVELKQGDKVTTVNLTADGKVK